jgi:calpain-15
MILLPSSSFLVLFLSHEEEEKYPFESVVHWRRAKDFLVPDPAKGYREAAVFYESIEPGDVKQGTLGDCWFMSALACLAERPKLVERLFVTQEANQEGVYRIKFCKNGEWVHVTVDDYFPCTPLGSPIFSRANANEMWVLLIEKAYAKLHGNYFTLRGGYANEGMIDLTGCPSHTHDFELPSVQEKIKNGNLFKTMLHYD